MILIVGGMAQGKKKFAEDMFAGAEAVRWADGASAALEDFAQAPFGCHFHLLIRRLMEGDPALRAGEMWLSMAAKEELAQALTRFLLERCRSRSADHIAVFYGSAYP